MVRIIFSTAIVLLGVSPLWAGDEGKLGKLAQQRHIACKKAYEACLEISRKGSDAGWPDRLAIYSKRLLDAELDIVVFHPNWHIH